MSIYLHFGCIILWGDVCVEGGGVLHSVECLTASLPSTPWIPVTTPIVTTKMSPDTDIAKCPLGDEKSSSSQPLVYTFFICSF